MKTVHLLLVEDNEGDILLTREALEECRVSCTVNVVKDGGGAIDFLRKKGCHENAPLPQLILLDINLPIKNGQEVLKFIKTDEELKHIPVIMFTTSSFENDIRNSYKNHANCYVTKPADVDVFLDTIARIVDYWTAVVTLPHITDDK